MEDRFFFNAREVKRFDFIFMLVFLTTYQL